MRQWALLAGLLIGAGSALAETPGEIIERYATIAKQEDPEFAGFSVSRGEKLYNEKGMIRGLGYVSCVSCHLIDPRERIVWHKSKVLCRACHVINDAEHPNPKKALVRHIDPLAPAASAKRFTDPETAEQFLKLNCTLVFKRECTTVEKGDVITWLMSIK